MQITAVTAKRVGVERARDGKAVQQTLGGDVPSSAKPNGLCPRCGRHSNFEVVADTPLDAIPAGHLNSLVVFERAVVFKCRGCLKGTVVVEEQHDNVYDDPTVRAYTYFHPIHVYPLPAAQVSRDVPADIAGVYAEAVTALAAGLPRAAVAMARAALDGVTKDKGDVTIDNFARRIAKMGTDHVLQPSLVEWSHEVRLIGNCAVHDPSTPVSHADARQLIEFLGELIRHLYVLPADLERRRSGAAVGVDVVQEEDPDVIARRRYEAAIASQHVPFPGVTGLGNP